MPRPLWALWTRSRWLIASLVTWVVSITLTGTLAPVAWGGAGWDSATMGGAGTAAVTGLVAWGALAHARAYLGAGAPVSRLP